MSDIGSHNEYSKHTLDEADLEHNPLLQLAKWLDDATNEIESNSMVLATASGDGMPSARVVLLRGLDERGLAFYTNYESRKGYELRENNDAAVVFYWASLQRQVRVTGEVQRMEADESDAYFAQRPHRSKLGAIVSNQSSVIPSREGLEIGMAKLEQQYPEGSDVPRPSNWGGYRLVPNTYEFWQGRESRLHDRFQFRLTNDGWVIERLAP